MHVARSTIIQPEAFGELLVGDILRRMPYTRDERARELARRADVAEMRRPVDLWTDEREALARQIARFARSQAQ